LFDNIHLLVLVINQLFSASIAYEIVAVFKPLVDRQISLKYLSS